MTCWRGRETQDHFVASLTFREGKRSIASDLALWNRPRIGLEWLLTRGGLGATSFFEVGALPQRPGAAYANMQRTNSALPRGFSGRQGAAGGMAISISSARCARKARGWLRLRSADPDQHPEIVFNYLDDPADAEEMLDGLAQTRDARRWAAPNSTPGPDVREPGRGLQLDVGQTEHHPRRHLPHGP